MNEDEQCGTCGCNIGGGCPDSTPYDRAAFTIRHQFDGDYSPEDIADAHAVMEA
jgi:hypothetical protein